MKRKRPKSHVARLCASERLQRLYSVLRQNTGTPLTTWQLVEKTGSCAIHSDIHELRRNVRPAEEIFCRYAGLTKNGRKLYVYWLDK